MMVKYFLKGNISMEKEMEKEKNIVMIVVEKKRVIIFWRIYKWRKKWNRKKLLS